MLYLFCSLRYQPPAPSIEKSSIHPCRLILRESCFFEYEHNFQNENSKSCGRDLGTRMACLTFILVRRAFTTGNEVVRRWHSSQRKKVVKGKKFQIFITLNLPNFWYFDKMVAEEKWSQSEVPQYYTLLLHYIHYLQWDTYKTCKQIITLPTIVDYFFPFFFLFF